MLKNIFKIQFYFTIARYFVSGGSVLILDFVLYLFFVSFLQLKPWWSDFLTTPFVWVYMFFIHKIFTFKSTKRSRPESMKFVTLTLFNTAIMPFIIYVCITYFGINFIIAKMISVVLVVLWNFPIYKFWVYK